MAAEGSVSATAGTDSESLAQKLLAKHAADEVHKAFVEDAPDEEDMVNTAPSTTMSDVAKGKQKVDDTTAPAVKPRGPALDVSSEEAFPSLGGGKAMPAPAWGRKTATNGAANGNTNGNSRSSTPASGAATPGAAPASGPGRNLTLPGQNREQINVPVSWLLPRQQMKKPIPDVIRDVNKRSKANVTMRDGPGMKVFEATGPQESSKQALREIMSQIGAKQQIKVPIPASVRSHIIGRQGATIQEISKRTGARIQMPKQDELAGLDDEDALIDVLVEGDYFSTGYARSFIDKIVGDRTANVSMRLKDIPAEFYPFIAGANNSRLAKYEQGDVKVNVPHYHTWREAAPPSGIARGQPVPFQPQASLPISITGDRLLAQQAREEIEAQVKQLQRQLSIEETSGINKARHQFLIGDRGMSAHDFLEQTGCALIKPPPGADDDTIFIIGPADRLDQGLDKVMELTSAVQQVPADIGKPHKSARGGGEQHARNLNRYLQQRKAVEEFERTHGVSLSLPTPDDSSTSWQICGPDMRAAMQAHKEIMNMVNAHPPSRFRPMQVDPFFHQTLRQREAPRLRKEHGVQIIFPDGHTESPDLLLVYEQPGSPTEYILPRQAASAADAQQHERALQQVMRELDQLVAAQQAIESRQLEAHPKFHDKIRRYVDREQQGLQQDQFPVQLLFGSQGRAAPQRQPNNFSIRGPVSSVDALQQQLAEFIEQEIKDEAERGFQLQFDYPQKYANHLIGKRGENINRLREEFDVDIQVKDGKVELTGPEKKCTACKVHVLSQLKKLEDEATHVIQIKPQFHRDLIGTKGSQVNRLQDRYNVRVNFPRNTSADEGSSDLGSVKNHRQQAPDEVIIKGPKKGADEAREELLNLLQYVMDNSHTAIISVQQSQIPQLIGAGGREMDKFRLETGCQIDIPGAKDGADENGRVEVKLRGTKTGVEKAKKMLSERIGVLDDTVVKTIDVERKHHKSLIGAGGSNIRKIVLDAGGPDDQRQIARIVRFPKQGEDDSSIRVEGSKVLVNKIVAEIEKQAKLKNEQVTDHIEVAQDKHRLLIGRGGEIRKNLESKFNVQLDIPRQGSDDIKIKIAGLPADVEKAKSHIGEITKDTPGVTVEVPRKLHNAITEQGRIFRRLRDDHGVTVDHAGQQPPPRPAKAGGAGGRARNVNGATPLITDDATAAADAHSWELIDNGNTYEGDDGETIIPWILKGSKADGLDKAKAAIESALAKAGKPSWTGYLILPDGRSYGRIIGPGGSQINSIKKQTGCDVQVPRGNRDGEAVSITGEKGKVEEARDIILEIVKDAGAGAGRGARRG